MSPAVERLVDASNGQVRVVYRHFPLISIHDKAAIAAEASEAAGAQGAFWEMHDLLFERQEQWASIPEDGVAQEFSSYAEELGLDTEQFDAALEDGTYTDKVMEAYESATLIGITATPSFVGDGVHYPAQQWGLSLQGLEVFSRLIGMKQQQFDAPPDQVIEEGKDYQATIKTDKGDIVVDLLEEETPVTVNSFAYLAEHDWYDDTLFHRVIPGFVAQGGDPTGTGIGWPGYRCSDELNEELAFDEPGVLGMANSGADTNGSQFFITLAAQPELNGRHTVFGQVIEGLDVVESLTARDPQSAPLDAPGDSILDVIIEEK